MHGGSISEMETLGQILNYYYYNDEKILIAFEKQSLERISIIYKFRRLARKRGNELLLKINIFHKIQHYQYLNDGHEKSSEIVETLRIVG